MGKLSLLLLFTGLVILLGMAGALVGFFDPANADVQGIVRTHGDWRDVLWWAALQLRLAPGHRDPTPAWELGPGDQVLVLTRRGVLAHGHPDLPRGSPWGCLPRGGVGTGEAPTSRPTPGGVGRAPWQKRVEL